MKEGRCSFLKKRTKKLLLIGALASAVPPAWAQVADRPTLQAVGLFQQACLPYAGYVHNLRQWAGGKNLRELPAPIAAHFLLGGKGVAFDASTPNGRLVLVSRDDGGCMVATPVASQFRANQLLQGIFRNEGAAVTPMSDKVSTDGKVEVTLEKVTLAQQAWHVSVTARLHPEDPAALANLVLMASATPL